ncbi:MAG: transcriptional regulator NrdR [Oscillospiraceae bacterium]|nr:transcriptional regulator NrdR [Oscillospiraceae bacterium]
MKCPFCGFADSKVIDSRPAEDSIRRRRECVECGKRFTTYEIVERVPLIVVKRDGSRQAFDKERIVRGVIKSCEKRPVTLAQIEDMANEIEQNLRATLESEVSSDKIGEMVMDGLKDLDEVAYVRFASVYRSFKDINTFMEELSKLQQGKTE